MYQERSPGMAAFMGRRLYCIGEFIEAISHFGRSEIRKIGMIDAVLNYVRSRMSYGHYAANW
jgi:hypothetical protein